jgi:hypothetical protein
MFISYMINYIIQYLRIKYFRKISIIYSFLFKNLKYNNLIYIFTLLNILKLIKLNIFDYYANY